MSDNHVLIKCKNPSCKKQFDVPGGRGKVMVACPHCGAKFLSDTSNAPAAPHTSNRPAPKPSMPKQPTPKPQAPKKPTPKKPMAQPAPKGGDRVFHLHFPKNFILKDKITNLLGQTLYINGKEWGKVQPGAQIDISGSAAEGYTFELRRTSLNIPVAKLTVPNGRESYQIEMLDQSAYALPENDLFGDLVYLYLKLCYEGPEVRRLMNDPDNRDHTLDFHLSESGIEFSCYLTVRVDGEDRLRKARHAFTYKEVSINEPMPAGFRDFNYFLALQNHCKTRLQKDLGLESWAGGLRFKQ